MYHSLSNLITALKNLKVYLKHQSSDSQSLVELNANELVNSQLVSESDWPILNQSLDQMAADFKKSCAQIGYRESIRRWIEDDSLASLDLLRSNLLVSFQNAQQFWLLSGDKTSIDTMFLPASDTSNKLMVCFSPNAGFYE